MEKKMSKTTTDGHRELSLERELSFEELEAVSGGGTIVEVAGHKVTTGDVAAAAKWVWNKLF
jgi:hypothetical protein